MLCLFCVGASAAEITGEEALRDLPSAAEGVLTADLLTGEKAASLFAPERIFSLLTNGLTDILAAAFRDCGLLLMLLLFAALFRQLLPSALSEGTGQALRLVLALTLSLACYRLFHNAYGDALRAAEECTAYLTALLPVTASLLAGSGGTVSAAVLPGTVLFGLNAAGTLLSSLLLPLCGAAFLLELASSATGRPELSGLGRTLRGLLVWAFSLGMALCVALLGLQQTVTAAADTAALKTAKMAIGSTVPVVGGALSDAFGSVLSGLSALRSTVGAVGVAALGLAFLPVIGRTLCHHLLFRLVGAVTASLDSGLSGLTKAMEGLWGLLLAVSCCQFFFMAVSLGILSGLRVG